jgi:thioredoxin reductase
MADIPLARLPAALAQLDYDVLIVGAGPAGLAAALTLGRCMRRVLLADGGPPRNECSPAVHGFLSRDGIRPAELLQLGRTQLQPYATVTHCCLHIERLTPLKSGRGFAVQGRRTDTDAVFRCTARRVLLCTGVADVLPPLPGFRELWGSGVLHCPYCHGYEVRQQPLAVYGQGKQVTGLALLISRWSPDVVVVTDGPGNLSENARRRLRRQGIRVREEKLAGLLEGPDRTLRAIRFEQGEELARAALFIHAPQHQRSSLAAELGARIMRSGAVWVDKNAQTSVRGLFAAGDTTPGQQQALVGAAEGNKAGICLNENLTREECPR